MGNTSYITNIDGEVYQHSEYLPFGEIFLDEHANTKKIPYLYNGKELDEETGFYYYGARYFSAMEARFLSVDRFADKFSYQSGYLYAGNNPIRYIDLNGDFNISPKFKKDYPKLSLYIMKYIEADMSRSSIKALFMEKTKISNYDYNEMIRPNSGPTITPFVGFGVGHNGAYEEHSKTIKINRGLLNIYKNASSEKIKNIALYYILKKIVHESSHYADYKVDGVQMDENETVIGEGLEKEIFHKLDIDAQEWIPGMRLDEDILSENPNYNETKYKSIFENNFDNDDAVELLKYGFNRYDINKMIIDFNNVRNTKKDLLPTPVK